MSLEEVKELCSQHLVYLTDMGFTHLIKDKIIDGRLKFELTITKPFYTSYDAYKFHQVDCELAPLNALLCDSFKSGEINLWTINEKYVLSRYVSGNLMGFNYESNFMEIGISYE